MHYVVHEDKEINANSATFKSGDCSQNFTDVNWVTNNNDLNRYEPT